MRPVVTMLAGAGMLTLALGVGGAWAEGKVTITREENTPATVEVKAGEEVRFINASGMTAHVWFAGNEAIKFYVGKGGSNVKFERPGTYEYTAHMSGGKVHAHTGRVVVK